MPSATARRTTIAAALGLMVCVGCVQPKHPKLKITEASFTGVDLQVRPLSVHLNLELKVLAENPNGFDLRVNRVHGKTTIAGKHEIPVELHPDRWLRANEASTFVVPVAIPADMVPSLAAEALLHACIPYSFVGEVDLVATSTFKLERNDYPLKKDGCLEREKWLGAIKLP